MLFGSQRVRHCGAPLVARRAFSPPLEREARCGGSNVCREVAYPPALFGLELRLHDRRKAPEACNPFYDAG
jgi:hypothetical protein